MAQNPLLDFDFLYQLDLYRNRTTYARITSLTSDNYPCEQIEGIVTAGNINIDGNSAVRRVCSLTITTNDLNINNIYWALTTRVKVEIGIENNLFQYRSLAKNMKDDEETLFDKIQQSYIDGKITTSQFNIIRQVYFQYLEAQIAYNKKEITIEEYNESYNKFQTAVNGINFGLKNYPDIIWFPQGIFILTDFKPTAKVNQYSIKITGKDKMCLLNGDISGTFNAETQLDAERTQQEDGGFIDIKKPISYIIREMIHHYGQENFHNIVIKDIDNLSLKMLANNTGQKLYLIQDLHTEEVVDISNGTTLLPTIDYYYEELPDLTVNFNHLRSNFVFQTTSGEDNRVLIDTDETPTILINKENTKQFVVIKIEDGEDIGYELVETYYPEDLIAAAGETVTSILDKIVKTFGAYEYFYNLEGQFVFQAKKTYVNTSWNNIEPIDGEDENLILPQKVAKMVKYSFDSGQLITSYSNNPQMGKIKNDFTVWGKKKLSSGEEIPIHMRYAIDKKPEFYWSYPRITEDKEGNKDYTYEDGKGYISEDFFNYTVKRKLIYSLIDKQHVLLNNEKYEIVDWREIIYQMALDYLKYCHDDDFEVKIQNNNYKIFTNIDTGLPIEMRPYERGKTGYEQYYHDIEGFWRTLYLPLGEMETIKITDSSNIQLINKNDFYKKITLDDGVLKKEYIGPWNKNIIENPAALLFWFDFFDANSLGLGQFSVPAIGDRQKIDNNDSVRAIYYKAVPNVILINEEDKQRYEDAGRLLDNYAYLNVDLANRAALKTYLTDGRIRISTRSITAQEVIDDLVYKNAYSNETVSLQTVPIYYLEPNTIISARDEERAVNGYYIINKITLPLAYKGLMKITAIKVPERTY